MNLHTWNRPFVMVIVLLTLAAPLAHADGLRDIASVTLQTQFDGTWRMETMDVFLARILPGFTLQASITRDDASGWFQHAFFLGPVVNLTDALYLDAGYGLAVDSAGQLTHEAEANLNYETEANFVSAGIRGNWFPGTGYAYLLPSVSGRFHPIPPLALFGKFFLSVDTASVVTESFWAEATYSFSSLIAARAGITVSRASGFGYSVITGLNLSFSTSVTLKYTFQYLSAMAEYVSSAIQQADGVSNALILDVTF